jgi:hypothetical protein
VTQSGREGYSSEMKTASVLVTRYLHTQHLRKAREILNTLTSILELEVANANVEIYPPDPRFTRFDCELEIRVESQRDAYFDFLERAGRIASGRLSVTAPQVDGTHWDFQVSVGKSSVPGVNTIDLSVSSS